MAQRSNILSFDEVRRNTRMSSGNRHTHVDKAKDSQNLTNIFKLDFPDVPGSSSSAGFEEEVFAQTKGAVPRQAIFSVDDLVNEDSDEAQGASGEKTSLNPLKRFRAWRTSRSKQAAEQAFEKAYGSQSARGGSDGGPRAAVYTGQMGASQKRASRIQGSAGGVMTGGGSAFHALSGGASGLLARIGEAVPRLSGLSRNLKRGLLAVSCTVVTVLLVGSIYVPAQHYYQQIRERDRLSAEYAAVQERNEALQSMVERLSTDDGLEDKAHAEFGLIKPDEETASVIGIEPDSTLDFKANIAPGSIPAPETWYSGVLDVLFFYDRG